MRYLCSFNTIWLSIFTLMFHHLQVCSGNDSNFVVINQKGIDPPSLDLLAREGVSHGLSFLYISLLRDCAFSSFLFLVNGNWSYLALELYFVMYKILIKCQIHILQSCHHYGLLDYCTAKSKEEKYGTTGLGLWGRTCELCGWSHSWLSWLGWTGLWAYPWGREVHVCGKCEEPAFLYNLNQRY